MPDYSFIARGLPPVDLASPLMQVEQIRQQRAAQAMRQQALDMDQQMMGVRLAQLGMQNEERAKADQSRAAQEQARAELPKLEAAVATGQLVPYLRSNPQWAQIADAVEQNPEFADRFVAIAYQMAGVEMPQSGGGDPYTLGPGSARYDASGKKIAEQPFAPQSPWIGNVAGVPTVVPRQGGAVGAPVPLSTLDAETGAVAATEAAKVTGKSEAERPANQRKAQNALEAASFNYDRMISVANRIKASPQIREVTGLIGSNVPVIPGTLRASLVAQIETLKSQAGFAILQAMRDASPTGGALGQVSERELTFLQNNIASLERAQTPEDFMRNLEEFITWAEGSKQRLSDAYARDFGQQGGPPQIQSDEDYDALPSGAVFTAPDGSVRRKP